MYGLPIRLRLRQLFLCEKQYFRSQFLSQEVGNMPRKGENIFKSAYCEAKRPDLRSKTVAFRF